MSELLGELWEKIVEAWKVGDYESFTDLITRAKAELSPEEYMTFAMRTASFGGSCC